MELMLGLGLLGALFGWGVVGWWRYGVAARRLESERHISAGLLTSIMRLQDSNRQLAQRLLNEQHVSDWLREAEDHAANNLR